MQNENVNELQNQPLSKPAVICCGNLEKMALGWMLTEDGVKIMPFIDGEKMIKYRVNNCPCCGVYVRDCAIQPQHVFQPILLQIKLLNMKYRIELSEEQMRVVAQCLEDVSRFASGQWKMQNTIEAMVKELPFDVQMKRRDDIEELLRQVKKVLFPEMSDNSSKGYNGTDFIGNTYQIYRTILYQLAKDNNWNNVYSSPALPSGNLGTIKIEEIKIK